LARLGHMWAPIRYVFNCILEIVRLLWHIMCFKRTYFMARYANASTRKAFNMSAKHHAAKQSSQSHGEWVDTLHATLLVCCIYIACSLFYVCQRKNTLILIENLKHSTTNATTTGTTLDTHGNEYTRSLFHFDIKRRSFCTCCSLIISTFCTKLLSICQVHF